MELAEYTYFQLNFETTLLHLTVGLQNFLMEDIPPHYCMMGYTDMQMLDVAIGFEANTKNCKKDLLESFWWHHWHYGNDVPVEKTKPVETNLNPPTKQADNS